MTHRQKSLIAGIGLPGLALIVGAIASWTRTSDAAQRAVTQAQLDSVTHRVDALENGLQRIETKVDSGNARAAAADSVIICSLEPETIRCGGRRGGRR